MSNISLFILQTCSVLHLPQLPPVQVPRALQAVHPGSQEDDDAAGHQPGGHPALRAHTTNGIKTLSTSCELWGFLF